MGRTRARLRSLPPRRPFLSWAAAAPFLRHVCGVFVVSVRFVVVASPDISSVVPETCDDPSASVVSPACVVAFAPLPFPRASAAFPFRSVGGSPSANSSAVPVRRFVFFASSALVVDSAPRPRPHRRFPRCRPAPSLVILCVGRSVSCRVWGVTLAHRTRHRQDTQLRPATVARIRTSHTIWESNSEPWH